MRSPTAVLVFRLAVFVLCGGRLAAGAQPALGQDYSTCKTWQEVVAGENLRYPNITRVSDPGTKEAPAYTGYWFYDGLQFDESGRYALAMKVRIQERDVTPTDRGVELDL